MEKNFDYYSNLAQKALEAGNKEHAGVFMDKVRSLAAAPVAAPQAEAVDSEVNQAAIDVPDDRTAYDGAVQEEAISSPPRETPEQTHFLDLMAEVEGVKRHQGAEANDKDTHGYGLKESTRKSLDIPVNEDPRVMATQAYDHFYKLSKKSVKNLDSMDNPTKTFIVSTAWNTNMVFGSAKRIAEAKNFKLADVKEYVSNIRTGQKNLAGLGNRRAKDYNILAENRGWPTIDKVEWTTEGGTFHFSDGNTAKINKNVEPTKTPVINL